MSPSDANPPDRPLIDGRYRLHALIGRGGMASVWRGRDELLNRSVAIKLFAVPAPAPAPEATMADPGPGPSSSEATPEERISTEVRLLAQLNHPNIVAVYDAVHDGDGRFECLVMELVDGVSLRERLHDGPLAPEPVAALGRDLANGLDYVHRGGIVHRDIKPANILLETTSRGERAKLVDFGIARLVDGESMTLAGVTMGTPGYLSPEQASGDPVGPPSDIYALGLVLLECLTGQRAFPGHGVETASARLHRDPPTERVRDASWRELLRAMTARNPADRPEAAAVAGRLDALARRGPAVVEIGPPDLATELLSPSQTGPTDQTGTTDPTRAPERRRRRDMLIAAAVAGGLTVALASVLLAPDRSHGNDGSGRTTSPSSGVAGPGSSAPLSPVSTASPVSTVPSTGTSTPAATPTTVPPPASTAVVIVSRTATVPAPPKKPSHGKPVKSPKARSKP